MSSKKLMIVDDSPAIHLIIEKAAKANGYEVCAHAKNGDEAVKQFELSMPNVVTMDITMPIKDGLAASKDILARYPDAKILMLSAMGDEELINEAKSIGISRFMRKPFKGEEIINEINSMLQI
ncbi:response regulator [Petroclostridium sp. X23]|uniref:response regulator n=1 Tax=Petroclostridium sp. X23 TaxID=3045146 RepID=UPI0024ACCBE6|nr:response regulator [Petroclostridium sp. X23]WHH61359.1 response regulator [Petroclostridium sp. X23]